MIVDDASLVSFLLGKKSRALHFQQLLRRLRKQLKDHKHYVPDLIRRICQQYLGDLQSAGGASDNDLGAVAAAALELGDRELLDQACSGSKYRFHTSDLQDIGGLLATRTTAGDLEA